MTVGAALSEGWSVLTEALVDTPLLDATVLLAEALSWSKEALYARPEEELSAQTYERFKGFLSLRMRGYPVSYIRRRKEFYGLEFLVDERVFVPRPETETLVEAAIHLADAVLVGEPGAPGRPFRVHDACTGSGAIAVVLKHLRPAWDVTASDISEAAREVFLLNSRLHLGRPIPFTLSDLLRRVRGPFDVIVSNPPYLRDEEVRRMKEGGWPEPEIALNGGREGLEVPRRLIRQAAKKLAPEGALALEADPEQMAALSDEMERSGFGPIRVVHDLGGRDRVIWATRRGRRPRRRPAQAAEDFSRAAGAEVGAADA